MVSIGFALRVHSYGHQSENLGCYLHNAGKTSARQSGGEGVFGEDEWLGLCYWVFVTMVAPVDLAVLWVLGELLQVTGEDIALLWLVWAVRLDWDLAGEHL